MPEPVHDLERLVAAHGRPSRARRAEVVPAETLAGEVGALDVKLDAAHAGSDEEAPEPHAPRALGDRRAHEALPARLGVHRHEERDKRGLDAKASGNAALGRFECACARAVDSAVHMNHAVLEVDVGPQQGVELAGAEPEVDADRDGATPMEQHLLALDETEELGREEVGLRSRDAAVGWRDVAARVVVAHPQAEHLRAHRLAEHLRDEHPNVARRLPRELAVAHLRVEHADESFDLAPRYRRHLKRTDHGFDVIRETALVVVRRRQAARFSVFQERAEPGADGARRRAGRIPAGASLSAHAGGACLLLLRERALARVRLGRTRRERRKALLRTIGEDDDALEEAGAGALLDAGDRADRRPS